MCARYFTWDAAHFPHPKEMQAGLAEHGRKLVTIIDPHIKKDDNYYVYKEATSQGYLTKNKDGADFEGYGLRPPPLPFPFPTPLPLSPVPAWGLPKSRVHRLRATQLQQHRFGE